MCIGGWRINDLISRHEVIDKINERQRKLIYCFGFENDMVKIMNIAKSIIIAIPSAQPERDIPKKPSETIDKAWGRPSRQPVCPNCDDYLGFVAFIGDCKGPRISYCENCGQAIDWSDWRYEDESD